MDIDRLIEFRVFAEQLSFRRAAEELALSQSAMSRHIDDLERELGFRLFERDRHHVALTESGRRFLEEIRDYPEQVRWAATIAKRASVVERQAKVRLGYGRVIGVELVETALASLASSSVINDIELVQADSDVLKRSLAEGELDLALVRPPVVSEVLAEAPLVDENMVAVLSSSHPLSGSDSVTLERLFAEPIVAVDRRDNPSTADYLTTRIASLNFRSAKVVARADTLTSMLLLIEAGVGVGLAREVSVRKSGLRNITCVPICGAAIGVPIHLAWRRGGLKPSHRLVREALESSSRQPPAGYRSLAPS